MGDRKLSAARVNGGALTLLVATAGVAIAQSSGGRPSCGPGKTGEEEAAGDGRAYALTKLARDDEALLGLSQPTHSPLTMRDCLWN